MRLTDQPIQDPCPGLARRLVEAFVFAAAERAIAGLVLSQDVIDGAEAVFGEGDYRSVPIASPAPGPRSRRCMACR